MGFAVPAAVSRRVLIAALVFGAVSAFAGGALAIPGHGGGFPLSQLDGTPFTSFLVPGLLLGVVVGGTQLVAAAAVLRSHPAAMLLATIAGAGMVIWIYTELAMIGYSWLQTVYFALGGIELAAVIALLGVAPALLEPGPRP